MKLFVVGFPRDMEEIGLVELFSAHGQVSAVRIVTDQATGASKSYGFVTMSDPAGAGRAVQALDGTTIGGRTLWVRIADDKKEMSGSFQKTDRSLPAIPAIKKKRPRRP